MVQAALMTIVIYDRNIYIVQDKYLHMKIIE
jgi:hypothetical protein